MPLIRPRRLRSSATIRRMVRETILSPDDFILPLFVVEGRGDACKMPIASLDGCFHLSPDMAVEAAREAWDVGVPAVILFGLPEEKDPKGSGAWSNEGGVQEATRRIKDAIPEMCVAADTCMCEYTSHGHCGMLKGEGEQTTVDNDVTLELLAKTAVSQARAGADIVAPSDMMDGRVAAIREALDAEGCHDTLIMSYAAKYASAFYGPFREAVDSTPSFGDRKTYQMDPGNAREAVKEVLLDVEEGADIVMVKPAMPYLDIIRTMREISDLPTAAYQVSGEFAMIKAAGKAGLIDEEAAMLESLISIKRAGADMILSYFAVDAAKALSGK